MAKRFTDTELWEEDWFIAIPKDYRIFWCFLKDSCDHAGIWRPNVSKFNKLFDCSVKKETALSHFNSEKERIVILPNSRWFLSGFIFFQYGKVLNLASRMYRSVYELLIANEVNFTSIRPQIEVIDRVKDKDKDKDKDKEKEVLNALKLKGEFESLWERYPAKDGKKVALLHFNASVRNDEDILNIRKALENYLNSERVKNGYVKNGSTWFGNWTDWINYTDARPENDEQRDKRLVAEICSK